MAKPEFDLSHHSSSWLPALEKKDQKLGKTECSFLLFNWLSTQILTRVSSPVSSVDSTSWDKWQSIIGKCPGSIQEQAKEVKSLADSLGNKQLYTVTKKCSDNCNRLAAEFVSQPIRIVGVQYEPGRGYVAIDRPHLMNFEETCEEGSRAYQICHAQLCNVWPDIFRVVKKVTPDIMGKPVEEGQKMIDVAFKQK